MTISFDKALGIAQHTVGIRAQRAELIASNIVNADTPHYKARDMDFATAMRNAESNLSSSMARTHDKHFKVTSSVGDGVAYRIPNQPDTGDGNTVDVQMERNLYMKNALEYQSSLQFLGGKFKGLRLAIKGS
ncbi:flagellar basal body rod protein FlgB [Psychrobium sp. 1_MG-2023]|uniref:flagellar basal body rod protein FlgB n=1 Tax=Psychrobium sp. 1_MG-2023 TaxID=3062624 RepID=UPI000C3328AA|nr:flagellar basal body rod protein FlgB [Psychrobium sp. 1_MG-2023]MDP2559873.1 flagellar basal body rod protein FlgB [Psychrobium sp. 1_MG-2023]PKF59026.1 flagellar basal body rod protein FlgB [Alteromonadales bacterium alter-6D02]